MYSTRYTCQVLTKLEFSRHIFEETSNIKFHKNPSSGSRVVPCGRTDITKLTIAFHNFANAQKNRFRFIFRKVSQICIFGQILFGWWSQWRWDWWDIGQELRTWEITQYFNRIPTGKIKIGGSRCRWHYIKMALKNWIWGHGSDSTDSGQGSVKDFC